MIKKIGTWVGSFKNYFSEVQKDITDLENTVDEEITIEEKASTQKNNNKKDE